MKRTAWALFLFLPLAALAAPRVELWPRWQMHDAASSATVDHAAWDAFLRKYLVASADGIHRLRYASVDAADRAALDAYVQRLQGVAVARHARAEQRAYWINLYNAATVQTVLAHYPVKSILDIDTSPGVFARGPWGDRRLHVEGEALALDDIEHRILRPIWQDPRTHYAVNCASLGCPNLATRAYTAANLEAQLDEGARAYVNHPRGARVVDGELIVSSIYEWFKPDFGGSDAGVIAHLRKYAGPELQRALQGVTAIGDDAYDWRLNAAP